MRAFGFAVQKAKGNDLIAIDQAIEACKKIEDQAVCIILDSVKGQGVKFFEEMAANHSVKFDNDAVQEATDQALEELRKGRA